MFNKENNNVNKIELEANNLYKQYDNIYITPSFITMLSNYYELKNMENHLDYDNRLKLYKDNTFILSMKKQYDNKIVNLYHNGKLSINNTIYNVNDFYIVYNQDDKDYHLLCIDSNYDNEPISYNTSIKLIDTTAFMNLIQNSEINDNVIIIPKSELLEIIKNWDGLIHNEVCETDAIINRGRLEND